MIYVSRRVSEALCLNLVRTLQLSKILIRTRIWPVSRQQILIRTMPKTFEDFGQNLIRIGYGLSKNLKNLIRTGIWHSAVLSGVLERIYHCSIY